MAREPESDEPSPEVTWALRMQSARLVVRERDELPKQVNLDGKMLRLGRAADNEIVVKAEFVAPHHARLEPSGVGGSYRIVDLGGGCGLLYGGKQVREHVLRHGDVVRIGDPVTGGFVTIAYQRLARTVTPSMHQAPRCSLKRSPEVSLGREGCDLNLASLLVSRRHALVRALAGGGHEVRDLGSANGTFVNGARVQVRRLEQGDIIQIGPFKLVYEGDELDPYDQRGAMQIKARDLVRTVGMGRAILNHVSLVIQPREFVAIVGGSGTGKSTLLGALSGFSRANSGQVLVNGDDYYQHFDAYRGVIGYVPQTDILHQQLSVEEALRFTALLRLPEDTAEAEIMARVERVLEDVEMGPHRATRIGELSGGQRKRVSIAAELLADPSLFYLDEPTSGLDPGLEKKLMYTLRRLADAGRTVVMVTHATANIHQCDHVVFMAEGRMVWFGPPSEALKHFGAGDFADIYTKIEGEGDIQHPLVRGELRTEYQMWAASQTGRDSRRMPSLAELWELRFRRSDAYSRYVYERMMGNTQGPVLKSAQATAPRRHDARGGGDPAASGTFVGARILPGAEADVDVPEDRPDIAPLSSRRQLRILTRRYLRLLTVDRRNLLLMMMQAPIIGAILVIVAKPDALQNLAGSHGRLVLFLVGLVATWFGILNAVRELTKERAIYRRERLANLQIWPYVLSKLVVLGGVCLLQSVILLGILALEVDFSSAVKVFTAAGPQDVVRGIVGFGFFGALLMTTFLSSLCGLGMGLLLSSVSSTSDRAMSLVPLVLVPQLLLALALVPLPSGLAPLSYITSARWSMEAFGGIAHLPEPRDFSQCTIPGNPLSCPVYPTVSYAPTTAHVLTVWAILLLISAGCVAFATWWLYRRDSER